MSSTETGCCPKFDRGPWDDKLLKWDKKKFVKGRVWTFLYVPLNFGGVISRLMKKIEQSEASCMDNMGLSDHRSPWVMDLYLAVDKEVPGLNNVTFSGDYLSRVYEGDYKDTNKWGDDFKQYAQSRGLKIKKWYMWYTTCPKCAKAYGKNYVVTIAEV